MDEAARYRWLAVNILPCEGEVRLWLQNRVRSLSTADHDDLIQEAYVRIWKSDPTQIANPRGYFYTIVRNLLIEEARRARIVPLERMGEIEGLKFVSEEPGPEQHAHGRQALETLCRIIATLPNKMRSVFNLRSFEGFSRKEIADRLGISERTVEKQLQNAHLRITEALTKQHSRGDIAQHSLTRKEHDADR